MKARAPLPPAAANSRLPLRYLPPLKTKLPAATAAIVEADPARSAHHDVKDVTRIEEKLAAHISSISAGVGDGAASICAGDPKIVISCRRRYVLNAIRAPKTTALAYPDPKTIARSDTPASQVRFCKTRFIVFKSGAELLRPICTQQTKAVSLFFTNQVRISTSNGQRFVCCFYVALVAASPPAGRHGPLPRVAFPAGQLHEIERPDLPEEVMAE
jgi:hypothetical protein